MQDISDLIKEAKPLYHARKRRNNIIKSSLAGVACLFLVFVNIPNYQVSDDFYNPYVDFGYDGDVPETYVESLGLPVDDYGLLLVG